MSDTVASRRRLLHDVDDAPAAARRMREEGVYVVAIEGALRLGLCSVKAMDVPQMVESAARAVHAS